jgi:hypothetical protein
MLDEKKFEEKLSMAIAYKERLKKYERLSRLRSEVKRKLWIQKMWLPLSGMAAASVVVIFYLTWNIIRQEGPAICQPKLISQEDLTKNSQQYGDSSRNRILNANNSKKTPFDRNLLTDKSRQMKNGDIVIEDSNLISQVEKSIYSPPNDLEIKTESDIPRADLKSDKTSLITTDFSTKAHPKNHNISNENPAYCPAIRYFKEDEEIIDNKKTVLMLKHQLEDKFILRNDTIILKLSNMDLLLKLNNESINKGNPIKLWIDGEGFLVIDARKITGDFLRIKRG